MRSLTARTPLWLPLIEGQYSTCPELELQDVPKEPDTWHEVVSSYDSPVAFLSRGETLAYDASLDIPSWHSHPGLDSQQNFLLSPLSHPLQNDMTSLSRIPTPFSLPFSPVAQIVSANPADDLSDMILPLEPPFPFVDPLSQMLATSPKFDMFDNSFLANIIDTPSTCHVSAPADLQLDYMLGTPAAMASLDRTSGTYSTIEHSSDLTFALPYTFAWNTNTTGAANQDAGQDEELRQYERASTPNWNALGLTGVSPPSIPSLFNAMEVESQCLPTFQNTSPPTSSFSRKRRREEQLDIDELSCENVRQQRKKRKTLRQSSSASPALSPEERPEHEAIPLPNGRWMCTCGNPNTYSRKHDVTRHASKKSTCPDCGRDLCRFDALQRHMGFAREKCRGKNTRGSSKSEKRRKQRGEKSKKASSCRLSADEYDSV